MHAGQCQQRGNQVHRDEIHEVHQEYPDEYGQRQGCNQLVLAVEGIAHGVVDELYDHLHDVDRFTGYAGFGFFRHPAKQPTKDDTQPYGPQHRIDVNRVEAHSRGLVATMGHHPCAAFAHHRAVFPLKARRQFAIG